MQSLSMTRYEVLFPSAVVLTVLPNLAETAYASATESNCPQVSNTPKFIFFTY